MTGEPVFETRRTVVRPWRAADADRFLDLYRRPEVTRWLGGARSTVATAQDAEQRIVHWAALATERPDEGRWAVERKDDGVVAGTVLLVRLPDGDGEFEVGWHFHPDSWGQGFATEAGRGAVRHGFDHGLEEIFAVVKPDNERSLAVCRRIPMTPLGRTSRYYSTELELFRTRAGRPRGGVVEIQTDLAVRRHGRPPNEAPTLVFLHGLTDSGRGWPGAVAHWQDRYAIIAVDQRGHGESPRFTPEQLEGHPGDVLVDDLVQLLEQLGSAPVLVGHSLGGAVALATAVRRPDLVRALVLEDPAPLGDEEDQRSAVKGRQLVEGVAESVAAQDDEALLEVRRKQHPDWPVDELLVTGRAEQQTDREFLAVGDYKPSARWSELLAELTVPALLVTGVSGDIVVDDQVGALIEKAGNPNLTVERVPGAEHCVRRARPDRFFELADAFLARH